ncbi:MAG: SDR family NAD(P)-dependent oxidoreductase [Gammaproteobacteria bacterium]|nr:MAG: SDR family NAD(P)-dependent oxidoreductase [Gammaproteobacteria bacterium]UCH39543.1 MAG: SDR family NAD(P)-dependent oxidoreductase [Gammaproteobacteria bacterium]
MTRIPDHFSPATDLLQDKIVLVTGATGGFGKPVSQALARHGATVILLARNLRTVEALYDEIEQDGFPTPAIYPMNLEGATEHDYQDLANNIGDQLGRLDGLIHCAAILGAPTVFAQSDAETWYQVFQVNLHAPYLLTRACLPLLEQSGQASILFMIDDKPGAYWDAYQVSKQGLTAMAGLLAREYEGTGIRVNCFNPGKTRTSLQLRAYPAADENERLPSPQDHVDTFLYLMSDLSTENGETFTPNLSR